FRFATDGDNYEILPSSSPNIRQQLVRVRSYGLSLGEFLGKEGCRVRITRSRKDQCGGLELWNARFSKLRSEPWEILRLVRDFFPHRSDRHFRSQPEPVSAR